MIRRYLAAISATALAAVTSMLFAGGASAAPTAALTRLGADVIPGLNALAPLGPTPPSTAVEIDVALSGASPAAEATYLQGVYTKGSANYHRFLTTAQVASEFGAPQSDYSAALAYATAHGLTVVRTSNTRELVVLSGTIAEAERTFGVSIDNYRWHGLSFYANVGAPAVPARLGILGVVGLNTAQVMHTDHLTPGRSGAKPAQTDCEGADCVGATTPEDLWASYDQPSSDGGQGQTEAIFGEGAWTPPLQDLRDFEANPDQLSTCGGTTLCADALPAVPVRVVEVDGASAQYTDTAGDEEWDIDTQSSTGMAPDLQQLDLYFGTNLDDADVLNVVDDWASDPSGPLQASASYGECEYDPAAQQLPSGDFAMGQAAEEAYEQTVLNANAEGRTLFSSSGDDGSSCPIVPVDTNGVATQAFPDVNVPCALTGVVCVGGTVLYDTDTNPGTRAVEYSWNDSGGGTSLEFPEPAWQSGVAGVGGAATFDCLYTVQGSPVTSPTPCRAVPDISAQSGDIATNGYGIYYDGGATLEGGTSLSSPLSLGMWDRIQAAAPAGGLGFANPEFYTHASDFYDVGNPQSTPASPPTSNGYFVSAPGWDYVSGLGVMDVTKLAQAIDHTVTPTNDEPSPNSPTITYVDGTNGYQSIGSSGGTVDPACVPLFTGSPGESSYPPGAGTDYPQLDVLQGDIHNDSSNLTAVLTVEDLETGPTAVPPPGTAIEYFMIWTYSGTEYYLNAEIWADGDSFSYGTVTGGTTTTFNPVGTATGAVVPGTDGTITITAPLSDLGSPANGDTLVQPHAAVDVWDGTPASTPGIGGVEAGYQASTAGPGYDYALGEICAATGQPGSDGGSAGGGMVPEAPYAIAIPVLGLGAAGIILVRRRRRAAAATVASASEATH